MVRTSAAAALLLFTVSVRAEVSASTCAERVKAAVESVQYTSKDVPSARASIRRCAGAAKETLQALAIAEGGGALFALEELAVLAPEDASTIAIEGVVRHQGDAAKRKAYVTRVRQSLQYAVTRDETRGQRLATLVEASLAKVEALSARIDLLNVLGGLGTSVSTSAAMELARAPLPPDDRVRLARALAHHRPEADEVLIGWSEMSQPILLRAEAVRALAGHPRLAQVAENDPSPRVRRIAVEVAGGLPTNDWIVPMFSQERWPLVHEVMVTHLASHFSGLTKTGQAAAERWLLRPASDSAEPNAPLWVHATLTIGRLGLQQHRGVLRERVEDGTVHPTVRAASLAALAQMCDRDDVSTWRTLALRAAKPVTDIDEVLGLAAIDALHRVAPDVLSALTPAFADAPRVAKQRLEARGAGDAPGCPGVSP